MADHRAAKDFPKDLADEIRELGQEIPCDGAWLRWLRYSTVVRRVDRIHNYPLIAANAMRYLKGFCQDKGLLVEIEALQHEFEDVADRYPWVGMACPPSWNGRFEIGVHSELGIYRDDIVPNNDKQRQPVIDRVVDMTFDAHWLLFRTLKAIPGANEPAEQSASHVAMRTSAHDVHTPTVPATSIMSNLEQASASTLYMRRLQESLRPILRQLDVLLRRAENDDALHIGLAFLTIKRIRPVFDCLWHLGLFGDARALVGNLKALGEFGIGPKMDEILLTIATENPEIAEGLRAQLGDFPTPDELAKTSAQRKANDALATVLMRETVEHLHELLRSLENPAPRAGTPIQLDSGPPPAETECDGGMKPLTGSERNKAFQSLNPAEQKAYLAFQYAESQQGCRLEDKEAHKLLDEEGISAAKENLGELIDYAVPNFSTWSRQLREARKVLQEQKYRRRGAARPTRSIVKGNQIENRNTEG